MAKGVYVPLDVNYLRDPKIRRAGTDAELLYLRGLAHAKGGSTDGFIADFDLEVVGVGMSKLPARVAALTSHGLWKEVEGGWRITGWTKWNKTNKQMEEDRQARKLGAEKTNHKKYHVGPNGDFNASCSLCRAAMTSGGANE